MNRALQLARRGAGKVNPNPMVGAVIVQEGNVIGEGYHRKLGGPHAEVNAINTASGSTRGATLYVNLEPCCHWGKTPPCVEAVIAAEIKRAVIGTVDPNPAVKGKGIEILREHAVEVTTGILEQEARRLNEAYFKYVETGLPFVTVKYAQSLDGRIATVRGDARWISSQKSRTLGHRLRAVHDAIMIGIETVLADDPQLTVRLVKGQDPLRVILDSRLRIPLNAQVLRQDGNVLIATTDLYDRQKYEEIRKRGAEICVMPRSADGRRVELDALLQHLAARSITSILVEGGREVIAAVVNKTLVDRMVIITAPIILGQGVEAIGDLEISTIERAIRPSSRTVRRLGSDVVYDLRL